MFQMIQLMELINQKGAFGIRQAHLAQGESWASELVNAEENITTDLTMTQYQRLIQLMKTENENLNNNHDNDNCTALLAGTYLLSLTNFRGWIIDTGAKDHMCYNLQLFTSYSKLIGGNHFITIPDGRRVEVKLIGTLCLSNKIELKRVLYVPVIISTT